MLEFAVDMVKNTIDEVPEKQWSEKCYWHPVMDYLIHQHYGKHGKNTSPFLRAKNLLKLRFLGLSTPGKTSIRSKLHIHTFCLLNDAL